MDNKDSYSLDDCLNELEDANHLNSPQEVPDPAQMNCGQAVPSEEECPIEPSDGQGETPQESDTAEEEVSSDAEEAHSGNDSEADSDDTAKADSDEAVETQAVAEPRKTDSAKCSGKKSNRRKAILIFALVSVAAACVCAYLHTHAILGNLFGRHEIYSSKTTEINLSGSDYKDYSQLSKVKSLEVIDLTNSSFVSLSDLYGCRRLKKIILTGRELSAEDCAAFYRQAPDAHVVCSVNINGQVYDSGITQLKAEKSDANTQKLYAALNRLEVLDMTACDVSDDTYQVLDQAIPDCNIIVRTNINGTEYSTDIASLTVEGELTQKDAEHIGWLKSLEVLDIRKCTNPDLLKDFLAQHPDVRLNNPIELLGKMVGTEDEFVDLRGEKYTFDQVRDALAETLPKMKSLKKIDMCGCGLTNDQMEQLCKAYPDIKFVWIVHFKRWSVRTDAVVFSTLNGNGMEYYNQNDYAPVFKYCTDLRALDLGHSLITDISPIASLKKLRAVILTDNKIHRITAFSELKDLEFIEMNVNRVESASPLKNLENLKYIDFWSSMNMTDLSPLYHHDQLRIAILHRTVPSAERERFRKSNPDCKTFFTVDYKLSTNQTWRSNPYRKKIKVAFKNWKYVVGFNEETGEYIFDYDTDQYSIM